MFPSPSGRGRGGVFTLPIRFYDNMAKNPILNNPYDAPRWHYATNAQGELDYDREIAGRRVFTPTLNVIPVRQGPQKQIFEVNDESRAYGTHLVNLSRREVGDWRAQGYPHVTRVSGELLRFWFENPARHAIKRLFFAQREAIETAIWLNEAAPKSNAGQHILSRLAEVQQGVSAEPRQHLPRVAFKMATGAGKTVVMACLLLYHFFNRQEYRSDPRFADYFLVIAPGITIKDRLNVLFVDKKHQSKTQRTDYYAQRDLVPRSLEAQLAGINARIVVTNYHSFEPRTLQGNKRSPFDGKISGQTAGGKAMKQEAQEAFAQVCKRVLGNFKAGARLLILNDEAHHCYLPKAAGKTKDNEEADENAKAAVWFTGLVELHARFKVTAVYDLSATPYYLQGSGYPPYSLFDWVVSDFGLIEAIEAGLVKIPYLPQSDSTQELTTPVLKNLYDHARQELPKKGQRTTKKEARHAGQTLTEEPPHIPPVVKMALDQFYTHYVAYSQHFRSEAEAAADLFTRPPVFIVVCNNTSVSKEVYKFIAGYESETAAGERRIVRGQYDLFANYDGYDRLKPKAPTLLIDSDALEDGGQIHADFKKIFAAEIAAFKQAYAVQHGHGEAEKITDADILREVVNTVGSPGKLGGHVRCVVSVSMLTEGWDANTVTHIMGLRAFGSQLLCEQVAGRALRRMNYELQSYDKDGNLTTDGRKIHVWKFPPEYAHIIGVPFNMFKGGETPPVKPRTYTQIDALPARQAAYEITFPNIVGYRIAYQEGEMHYDFSDLENYTLDGSKFPIETTLATAFSPVEQTLTVQAVLAKRTQEILYAITRALLVSHFADDDQQPAFHKFNRLKQIVAVWYEEKVTLLNILDPQYKKLLYFEAPSKVAAHIARGLNPQCNTSEHVKPKFNHYNPFGSTKYVSGLTVKEVFPTAKSQVNYVAMDSGWEGICAKTLEELDDVIAYVKNQFLGLSIPYVKDGVERQYFPDFAARVRTPAGGAANLLIEVTGMNQDKAEKTWYVENRWLPAVNAVRAEYGCAPWHFIEIANDIREIKNQLSAKIRGLRHNNVCGT